MTGLLASTDRLLREAANRAGDPGRAAELRQAADRLAEPLRVAIAGRVKAGKSTLLNALVGSEVAPTDAGECTRIVTWYRDGPTYRVLLYPQHGDVEQRPFVHGRGAIEVDLGGHRADEVDHLEVWWPSRRLAEMALLDTPGLASLSREVSARTGAALTDDDRPRAADAILFLMRHVHARDARFLEAFQDEEMAGRSPVDAVGVLSRADEIGACRLDAMQAAARVARRYEAEPRLRRLCPVVLPVAGLLGASATTLREEEFAALAGLACQDGDRLGELLLTADRFAGTGDIEPPAAMRRQLLERLGLFGVRLSVDLLRRGGVTSSAALARELTQASGIDELRRVLVTQFLNRARVLKARSGLAAFRRWSQDGLTDHRDLDVLAEQIESSAHEFVEIRLLHLLVSERLPVDGRYAEEMARLLGGRGADVRQRLGLEPGADDATAREAAWEALQRWRGYAHHPLWRLESRTAANAVVRSCEGLVAALAPERPGPPPA